MGVAKKASMLGANQLDDPYSRKGCTSSPTQELKGEKSQDLVGEILKRVIALSADQHMKDMLLMDISESHGGQVRESALRLLSKDSLVSLVMAAHNSGAGQIDFYDIARRAIKSCRVHTNETEILLSVDSLWSFGAKAVAFRKEQMQKGKSSRKPDLVVPANRAIKKKSKIKEFIKIWPLLKKIYGVCFIFCFLIALLDQQLREIET